MISHDIRNLFWFGIQMWILKYLGFRCVSIVLTYSSTLECNEKWKIHTKWCRSSPINGYTPQEWNTQVDLSVWPQDWNILSIYWHGHVRVTSAITFYLTRDNFWSFYWATSPNRSCTEELSSSGQLCVRTKGGLVPMLDFLKQHGYVKPLGFKVSHKQWLWQRIVEASSMSVRPFIPGKRRPNRCHPKVQLHRSFVRYRRRLKAMCDIIRRRIMRRPKHTTLGADMCGG